MPSPEEVKSACALLDELVLQKKYPHLEMTTQYYSREQIAPLIGDMLAQIEDSLQLAKTACEENAVLRQELQGTKVRLEKVASALIGDPNAALQLVDRIATLLALTPSRGEGIPKTTSAAQSSDPDGWGDVIAKRAA